MTLYADFQPGLYPTGLAGPYGTAWGRSQGTMKDRVITLAIDAVDTGLVLRCPDDALPMLGADAAILPLPGFTSSQYRARIAGGWDTWVWAGTQTALVNAGALYGVTGPAFFTGRDWRQGRPDLWARWWMVIPSPAHGFTADGAWDDAGTYDDGGTWDSDLSADEAPGLRAFFRQVTNARDAGWLRFLFGATDHYDDGGIWDGGEIVPEHATDDTWVDDPAFFEVRI